MTDQTIDSPLDQSGPPTRFSFPMPGWWPRIEPVFDFGDRVPRELPPEQAEAIQELFAAVNAKDGTRLISIMMSAEDTPRPMGIMYVNYSEKAGQVMSGLMGLEGTPDQVPDLRSVGRLNDNEVSIVHFDNVGPVSCVMSRRATGDPSGRASLIRAYIIPQPHTMKAMLIVYITADHEPARQPFADLCDDVTSNFTWGW